MIREIEYPFQLDNAFFISLEFRRAPEMQDQLELQFSFAVKVLDERYAGRLQIHLVLETHPGQPMKIRAELVGLFDLVEGHTPPDRNRIPDFVNERALFVLWPYMTQMIRQITAEMGTTPVNLRMPYEFDFRPAQRVESDEEE
jgi:preprotein translocase subunit SecB